MCMGCRTCLIACVEAHSDKPIFEADMGDVTFNPKLHMIKSYDVTVPYQCRHCENPDCLKACKKDAIHIEDGIVLIDRNKCDGCGDCVPACPFGAIDIDGLNKANKCDLCKGVSGGPACVRVCHTKALSVVENNDVEKKADDKRKVELLRRRNLQ